MGVSRLRLTFVLHFTIPLLYLAGGWWAVPWEIKT